MLGYVCRSFTEIYMFELILFCFGAFYKNVNIYKELCGSMKRSSNTLQKSCRSVATRGPQSSTNSFDFDSQWFCWSCQWTSKPASTESTDQSLPTPHIKASVTADCHYPTENVPSDFSHVLLMFCCPQSHLASFVFEGILSPTRRSWKMQLRYSYEWKIPMGPEMTRIILGGVADRTNYGCCEERTVGLSELKGIRWGVMNKINAIYSQNKGHNHLFAASATVFCFSRPAERNNWF